MNNFSYKNCNLSDSQDIPIPDKGILPFANPGENLWENALATPTNHPQSGNPFPGIHKISPPPMQNRNLQTNLMPPMGHLRRHQTHTPPNSLNVLLPIKRRQHQIPQPIRQIIRQLRTQHVNPIGHKIQLCNVLEKDVPKSGIECCNSACTETEAVA
jgi:hypothetical protein